MPEHTPSPQSVAVPLEDWQHVIGALKNAKARLPMGAAIGNVSDALSKVEHLQAAPAPSSLAGGDYTMALAEKQPFEAFPALAQHIERMAVGGSVGSMIDWDAFLRELNAALSPEAPARPVWMGIDAAGDAPQEFKDFAADFNRRQAALTPRHEAPASPTEREIDLLDAVMRAGGIVKTAAALPDKAAHLSLLTDALNRADAILTEGLNGAPVRHEAPAEGAGEDRRVSDAIHRLEGPGLASNTGAHTKTVQSDDIRTVLAALRARSSAPEAREEALGNLLAVIHGDGGHRALEVGTKQAALEAEKIVAGLFAAPSADKLRELVGASEDILSALSALSVAGKPIASLDTKLRDAINTLVPALAALKAEGA